ncbi:MAG: glycosyltransferase [Gammaproteobacteria bacterium]|jgi:glycosyltransferase involved in cell wall biosynthesis|nr:glycosyltransferase [Gammaproteobacteria bacterium]
MGGYWVNIGCNSTVASCLSNKYQIAFVVTEHSSKYLMNKVSRLEKQFVKHTYKNASDVVAVSTAHGLALSEYLNGRSCKIIPNAVDTDFFKIKSGGRNRNSFGFLAIGNLNSNKGFEILIRAFSKVVLAEETEARLEIGGAGPLRESLEFLARSLNISDRVCFLGRRSKREVREAIGKANTLVLSSYHETFGIVLVEALSSGVPVIATRCGGPEDVVSSSVGLTVEVGNIDQMSRALQLVAEGVAFTPSELRDYAIEHFGRLAVAQQIESLYVEARD